MSNTNTTTITETVPQPGIKLISFRSPTEEVPPHVLRNVGHFLKSAPGAYDAEFTHRKEQRDDGSYLHTLVFHRTNQARGQE